MSGKYLIILSMAFLVACNVDKKEVVVELDPANFSRLQELSIPAPKAAKHPHQVAYHGQTLSDDYFWLKDQGYPEIDDQPVLDYLAEENDYFAAFIEPNRPLVDRVFEEFKGRTDESEESVPYLKNGYQYRWYFRPGDDYRTYSRKYLKTGEEQVILDESALAAGYDYFVIGDWRVSPDNTLLAYTFDTEGDERYQLRIIDLNTGDYLTDKLEDV